MRSTNERVMAALRNQPTSAGFDRAMVAVSTMADHGKLWAITAAALALTGHRSAAARGIVSLVVASVAANLLGKRLFGGQRPPLGQVAPRRRLLRTPRSGTFPSGHSASAFAFAVGASIDDKRLAVGLVPLAVVVTYSRLHTGAHWLFDVLGGAILGACAALVDATMHRLRGVLRGSGRATP